MHVLKSLATIFACLLLLVGCQANGDTQQPLVKEDPAKQLNLYVFTPEQYPAVHAAAIEVLRDHGFRIKRSDYRFGTITTFPKESPTAAEFWIDDPTTPAQHRSDTLNAQQRWVRVGIEKGDAQYTLTVEALVERLQRPARYLTHSATGQLSAEYAATPTHLSDRGIDGPYAQVLTRDPHLEARLAQAIGTRVQQHANARPAPESD